jgi:hypothetical protein
MAMFKLTLSRFVFYSASVLSNIFWGAFLAAVAYAGYRYRAERIARKKASEAARKSMITGHIDNVNSNKEKNEKHRKATALAEAERRAAAAAAAAAALKAEEEAKVEIARAKERAIKMRSDTWKQLSADFKVKLCGTTVVHF